MFTKTIISAAVAIAVVGLSGVSFAETIYQGGPKGMMSVRTTAPAVQANKPYAQVLPPERVNKNKHIYSGGPKATAPHAAR